ncbi:hypothetical protein [Streptomyces sp. NPDC001068]|uniref:hypothetical protein n=1 Tax=Streptomyces sp. NPDC001068 TaxID=3364544 RepID=UPI0036C8DA75
MLDDYLRALDALLPVVETVPVWGPLLVLGVVAALVWPHRPSRRTVSGHVPDAVRPCADTSPDAHAPTAVTCTDTRPDVSVDTRTEASGHEARGES